MKRYFLQASHWTAHLILLMLLISLQTSLWPLLLSPFPPLLWVVPLVYIAVYYPTIPAFLYVFSLSLVASFASSALPFVFVFSMGLLTIILSYLRRRIFWSGPTYLALAIIVATALYPALTWLASRLAEPQPLAWPSPLAWVFQILLTPWVAFPLYRFFTLIDQLIVSEGMFRNFGMAAE